MQALGTDHCTSRGTGAYSSSPAAIRARLPGRICLRFPVTGSTIAAEVLGFADVRGTGAPRDFHLGVSTKRTRRARPPPRSSWWALKSRRAGSRPPVRSRPCSKVTVPSAARGAATRAPIAPPATTTLQPATRHEADARMPRCFGKDSAYQDAHQDACAACSHGQGSDKTES
jgi:hypothetical protein